MGPFYCRCASLVLPKGARTFEFENQGRSQEKMNKVYFVLKYIFSFLSSIYLFTLGFWSSKNRTLIDQISSHFGLHPRRVHPKIPQVDLIEWVPVSPAITLVRSGFEDGGLTLRELTALNALVSILKPKSLFEIGSFTGRTTENLAANGPKSSKIYTLDLPSSSSYFELALDPGDQKYTPDLRRSTKKIVRGSGAKVKKLYGDSMTFDFSPYKSKIDFVFVDGSHAKPYVRNDSLRALEMLRKGRGVIVWHDYDSWEGVTSALNELSASFPHPLVWLRGTHLVCCFAGLTPPLTPPLKNKR